MKYKDYLKTLTHCPFCVLEPRRIIKENENAFLTYSLAPYHHDHLLVAPKHHIEHLLDLSDAAVRDMNMLQKEGLKILNKLGHRNVSFLMREGDGSGKSVAHLHYHIIPNIQIELGNSGGIGGERDMLTEAEIEILLSRLTRAL